MTMDEFEILTSYRQAASPEKQVTILAELNACSVDHIIGILESHGEKIDKRTLPKKKPEMKQKDAASLNPVAQTKDNQNRPEEVFLTLGHLRRLCADMDDDVIIQADGALFTGLRFLCVYDIAEDKIRRTLELAGDTHGAKPSKKQNP